jgi:hypothetical protein
MFAGFLPEKWFCSATGACLTLQALNKSKTRVMQHKNRGIFAALMLGESALSWWN